MQNQGQWTFGNYKPIGNNKFVYWVEYSSKDVEDWIVDSGILTLKDLGQEETVSFLSYFMDVIEASALNLGAGFALVGYDGSRQQEAEDAYDEFYKEIVIEDKEIDYRTLKSLVPDLDL